jgi:exonuclease SbcC
MAMKITIQKLQIQNFKGIANLTVNFNQNEPTIISGKNKAGKSTIADAYYWVLFGIDSNANKEFTIRPQDANGKPIDKIECSVSLNITFDANQIIIKKVYRQKWTKKRGEEREEFTGNENIYFWNEVPISEKEYKVKIEALINEEQFKLISSFKYFQNLKWDEKRKKLYELSKEITDSEMFELFPKLAYLQAQFDTKTPEEYKREVRSKINKIKGEIDSTPDIIRELENQVVQIDLNAENAKKIEIQKAIDERTGAKQIIDKAYQDNHEIIRGKIQEIRNIENANDSKLNEFVKEKAKSIAQIEATILEAKTAQSKYDHYLFNKTNFENQLSKLRNDYLSANATIFRFQESKCEVCGQSIEASDAEQREAFNLSKSKALNNIKAEADAIKEKIEKLEVFQPIDANMISNLEAAKTKLRETKFVSDNSVENAEIEKLKSEIKDLEKIEFSDANLIAIESEKKEFQSQLDAVNANIAKARANESLTARIAELIAKESKLGKEIAKLEKTEIDIQTFIDQKAKKIQDNINHLFSIAKVKMFERQVNGALNPTCIILDNGVAWNETNTANKTNIGLDVINTFSKHFGISAPIFIDDCEGINVLLPCNSQTIQLHVSNNPLDIN